MNPFSKPFLNQVLLASFFFTGCAGAVDAPDTAITEDPLVTRTAIAAKLQYNPGFVYVPPGDTCAPRQADARIDFLTGELDVHTCTKAPGAIHASLVESRRILPSSDVQRLRDGIGAIRRAPRPGACPNDASTLLLDIVRTNGTSLFIDSNNACEASPRAPIAMAEAKAALDLAITLATETTQAGGVVDSTTTSITITHHPGFIAVPPQDACARGQGELSLDLATGALAGKVCAAQTAAVGASLVPVKRTLGATELANARKALEAIHQVAKPDACPSDGGSGYLDVVRPGGTTRFVNAQNSCFGDGVPMDDAAYGSAFHAIAAMAL